MGSWMNGPRSGLQWLGLLVCLLCASAPRADEIRAAYLSIHQITEQQYRVTFNVPAKGLTQRLALDVAFNDSVTETSPRRGRFVGDSYVTQWQIHHPAQLAGAEVLVDGLQRSRVDVLVRVEFLQGTAKTFRLTAASPQALISNQQSWLDVATSYLLLGVEHILGGLDHLLFVLALLILINDRKKLVATITAFTIAHSLTLASSALHWISLPVPPVEACIALSIVFVASEILHQQQGKPTLSQNRPWLVAFGFGLLHGLGFAAVLTEIGLPDNALITALVLFNVGVEIGQLLFVAVMLLLYVVLQRWLQARPVLRSQLPAYLIGGVASFWFIERVSSFWLA